MTQVRFGNFYRRGAVRGLQHGIALVLQILVNQAAQVAFVLDQQNRFHSLLAFGGYNHRFGGLQPRAGRQLLLRLHSRAAGKS